MHCLVHLHTHPSTHWGGFYCQCYVAREQTKAHKSLHYATKTEKRWDSYPEDGALQVSLVRKSNVQYRNRASQKTQVTELRPKPPVQILCELKCSHSQKFCFLNSFSFWKFSESIANIMEPSDMTLVPAEQSSVSSMQSKAPASKKGILFPIKGSQANKSPYFVNLPIPLCSDQPVTSDCDVKLQPMEWDAVTTYVRGWIPFAFFVHFPLCNTKMGDFPAELEPGSTSANLGGKLWSRLSTRCLAFPKDQLIYYKDGVCSKIGVSLSIITP